MRSRVFLFFDRLAFFDSRIGRLILDDSMLALAMDNLIDHEVIESLLEMGDPVGFDLISELVEILARTRPKYMRLIYDSLARGDLREAARGAHSLKSAAAQLGALKARDLCLYVEVELTTKKQSELLHIESKIKQMDEVLISSIDELRSMGYVNKGSNT